ncbi:hypothetical protein EMCRGX_G026507 [Ephydatia muelleri]
MGQEQAKPKDTRAPSKSVDVNRTIETQAQPTDTRAPFKSDDVNRTNEGGQSPLWIASFYGRLDEIKKLIEAGADVNQADKLYSSCRIICGTKRTKRRLSCFSHRAVASSTSCDWREED